MNVLKKWLALVVSVVMICTVAACSDKPSPSSSDESTVSNDSTISMTTAENDSSATVLTESTAHEGSTSTDAATTTQSNTNTSTTKDNVWGSRATRSTPQTNKIIDMKGATLILGTKSITAWGNCDPGESAISDKWIAWRKNFEKTYNCKIKNMYVDPYNLFTSLSTKLMSGDRVADVLTVQLFDLEAFRHAGLLHTLQEVSNLNIEHPIVQQSLVNAYTYNGRSYLLAYGTNINEVNGLHVNLDMIDQLGLDNPLELVKQKKWTWAALDKMTQKAYKDLNKNNKIDDADRFGLCFNDGLVTGVLRNSGVRIIDYQNGKFTYTFNNATSLNVLNAIKSTMTAKNRVYRNFDQTGLNKFAKGELLFMQGDSARMSDPECVYWDADFKIGYVPCPSISEGSTYYNSNSTWLGGVAIPKNSTNLEYIGCLLNSVMDMTSTLSADEDKKVKNYMGAESFELFKTYSTRFTMDAYCWQNQFKDLVQLEMSNWLLDDTITSKKYLDSIDSGMKNAVKDYFGKDPDLIE